MTSPVHPLNREIGPTVTTQKFRESYGLILLYKKNCLKRFNKMKLIEYWYYEGPHNFFKEKRTQNCNFVSY